MSEVKTVAMPICELCDRLTIAQLKLERLTSDEIDKTALQRQLEYFETGIDVNNRHLLSFILRLHLINGKMWDAEHDIRKGLDSNLSLEEIGRRALKIRDLNRIRVKIKNDITELVGQPDFADCKMNHASS